MGAVSPFLRCPECRYEVALVHDRQWVELECPGCGASIAGDHWIEVVTLDRPPSPEDIDRWIASHLSRDDDTGDYY
jgi:hypothetical protein